MEKLQKALEKARSDREARLRNYTPAESHAGDLSASNDAITSVERFAEPSQNPWLALPELSVEGKALEKKRILLDASNPNCTYFDVLRTRLRDEMRNHNARRVAVLSPGPNAGKSTVVSNLAFSLSRLPFLRSIVFDFDFRRPSQHILLDQKPISDMAAVVNGDVPFAEHMLRYGDNLLFGLNKGPVRNSAELLQSDQLGSFLDAVQEAYTPDLMLFDLPPYLVADDSYGFLRHLDGVLLVVEAEETPQAQIDSVEQVLSEKTNVFGVVLNKCNFPDRNDVSGYQYGYR